MTMQLQDNPRSIQCPCGARLLVEVVEVRSSVTCGQCGRVHAVDQRLPGSWMAIVIGALVAMTLLLSVMLWALAVLPSPPEPAPPPLPIVAVTPPVTALRADPDTATGTGSPAEQLPASPSPAPPAPVEAPMVDPGAQEQESGLSTPPAELPAIRPSTIPSFRIASDPTAAPLPVVRSEQGVVDVDSLLAELARRKAGGQQVGVYDLRSAEGRELARAFGATEASENAVDLGLQWLAKVQHADGHWEYGPNVGDYPVGATALATLAFLGAGHTHRSDGPYRATVQRALRFLLQSQNADGRFLDHKFYSHGVATMAVCEAIGMTKDVNLFPAARRALNCIFTNMGPAGGFGYDGPGDDTHVTSFQVMGLKSAQLVSLNVPPERTRRLLDYYDRALNPDGTTRYRADGGHVTPARTALGLFCRLLLGVSRKDPRVVLIAGRLDRAGPEVTNYFQTYYGTYGMFQMQGPYWPKWNQRMRDPVIALQIKDGPERGSWGGEAVQTALYLMTLEVYYRYLPVNQ